MNRPDATTSNGFGIAAAFIAVSAWGLSGVIAKDIDLGGAALGAYRFSIYGVVMAGVAALRRERITIRAMRASMAGGLVLGADVALFFSAIKLTSVANATVIGALQPIVVAVVAYKLFGEKIYRRDMIFAAIAIMGVAVVVFAADNTNSDTNGTGILLAVLAVFAWAGYFVFSKRAKEHISANEYTVGAALWTGAVNIPIALLFGQSLAIPAADDWIKILILAFGAGLLGHQLMNWSIQQIPLWISSTFTLLIPVVSAAAAWAFLGEALNGTQVIAMGVVLGALFGIVARQSGVGSLPRPLRR